ncbi:MAG TPA: hypothetical protein VK572_03470 [Burkholderiales bacterium]|nr:hypothetical protein [Burkholderiales bacterium]
MNEPLQAGTSARKIGVIGWGLIGLAFVVPFASGALGYNNAAQTGYQVGQMAIALGVLVLVTSLALKRRSTLVQSYGRVVVGIVLTLWALGSAAQQIGQENAQKAFLIESQQMQARQAARFVELGKRFDAIALNAVLTPASITSPAGISTGRDTIAQYRALLAERKALLTSTFAESEQFFNTRSPTEADKREALASMERGKGATISLYGDLDAVQSAVVQAISDILDWAASLRGKLTAKDGQLVYANAQQQTELQVLLAKLEATEVKQQEVLKRAAVSQQKAQETIREGNTKLQQILK